MNDDTEHFVRYREHVAARDEIKMKLQELELQQARLGASLLHLPEKVDNLAASIQGLSQLVAQAAVRNQQPAPEQDHATLALHRALDAVGKNSTPGIERWLLLAMIGGAGWMAARFFIGG